MSPSRTLTTFEESSAASRDNANRTLHPTADGTESFLTAEVSGDYAGLLKLVSGGNLSKNKFGGGHGS